MHFSVARKVKPSAADFANFLHSTATTGETAESEAVLSLGKHAAADRANVRFPDGVMQASGHSIAIQLVENWIGELTISIDEYEPTDLLYASETNKETA